MVLLKYYCSFVKQNHCIIVNMNSKNKTFTDIYNTYYKKAFYFVKSYVHDESVAEDIVSESLIKLWEQLKQREIDPIAPFLLTILKNKALDFLKHQEVERAALEEIKNWREYDLSIRICSLEECNPYDIFSGEVESIVNSTLKLVPPQTREVFMMSRFQNKSNKEIAESMNISIKSVEYHITKTLKVLRVALKDYLPIFFFLFI